MSVREVAGLFAVGAWCWSPASSGDEISPKDERPLTGTCFNELEDVTL